MNTSKPIYVIRLKYAKALKGLPRRASKMAEFYAYLPLFDNEKFTPIKGNFEVKSRVFLPEFKKISKKFGIKSVRKNRNLLRTDDPESYLRLFVYAVVRQTIHSEVDIEKLQDLVERLPLFDIRYWASIFREKYEKWGSIKALYKPARAFREVYELD